MLDTITIRKKYNPFIKLANSLLRKVLFSKREKHHSQNLPTYVGVLNEYVSIDITIEGAYDIKSMEEVLTVLKSGLVNFEFDSLIDVGANIGNHSVYLSKYFKKVIAFEPNPFTYEILRLNTTLFDNIKPVNIGLSSIPSSLYLSEDMRNLGGSQMYKNKDDIPKGLNVRDINLARLDDVLTEDYGKDILLKIDIEGHELDALRGGENFIRKNQPVISIEQHTKDFIDESSPTLEFLAKMNYEFFLFESPYDKFKINFLKPFLKLFYGDKYKLIKIINPEPDFYDSIIAIHKDKLIL
jgi:FkbM family methyltransferase